MWNYYKTVVVNSDVAEDGNPMFSEAEVYDPIKRNKVKAVNIWRNGQYNLDCIERVYKTVGYKGENAKLTIKCDNLIPKAAEDVHDLGLYQLSFKVEMDGKFLSDYASPAYQGFFKPIAVGLNITDDNAEGAVLAEYIAEQIKLALPENNEFIKVSVDDTNVIIDATDNYMLFKKDTVKFEKYEVVGCDTCLGEYIPKKIEVEVEEGKQPFATGTWILENLRLPNTLNYRYFGSNDEMPIAGEVYTQYTFDYNSVRPGLGGHSGVGQGIRAITTHTFYCTEAAARAFETAFAGKELIITEGSAE